MEIGRQNAEPGNYSRQGYNFSTQFFLARFSHISTSTAPTSSQYHQQHRQSKRSSRKSQSPISQQKSPQMAHVSMSNATRVRKSFSMNDMKSFLLHERLVEEREVELVPVQGHVAPGHPLKERLKPLITHSVTTPTLSPNSSLTKSLNNEDTIEEEESSLGRVEPFLSPNGIFLLSNTID